MSGPTAAMAGAIERTEGVVLMVGPDYRSMGGIASVVNVYRDQGLFERQRVRYVATHRDGGRLLKLRVYLWALATVVWQLAFGRVRLVHVHMSSRGSFWRKSVVVLMAALFRKPVVLHLHGSEFAVFYEKECGPWARRWISTTFGLAREVITLSAEWQRWVKSVTSNPRVSAVYNPVVVPSTQPSDEHRQPGAVLFLGRLGQRKGTFDLIEAAALARRHCTDLKVWLCGDGDLDAVRSRIAAVGLGDVVLVKGWVRGADKARLLAQASVYVLPSYHEGLPMSILEAMAAGLPIVSTPIAGIPEAVTDGVEGYLVAPGDVQALASRLVELVSSAAFARQMGAAAFCKVSCTFAADVVVPELERIYAERC